MQSFPLPFDQNLKFDHGELLQAKDVLTSEVSVPSENAAPPAGRNPAEADQHEVDSVKADKNESNQNGVDPALKAVVGKVALAGDARVVGAGSDAIDEFRTALKPECDGDEYQDSSAEVEGRSLMEVEAADGARIIGRSASALQILCRSGVTLLGISRRGQRISERAPCTTVKTGDILLLLGPTERLADVATSLGCLPLAERGLTVTQAEKAYLAANVFAAALATATIDKAEVNQKETGQGKDFPHLQSDEWELMPAGDVPMPEIPMSSKDDAPAIDGNQADVDKDKTDTADANQDETIPGLRSEDEALILIGDISTPEVAVSSKNEAPPADDDQVDADSDDIDPENIDRDETDQGMVKIHAALPKVNPSLVFGATMALWQPPRFTSHELLDTINEVLEGTGAIANYDEKMTGAGRLRKLGLLTRLFIGPPSAQLRINGLNVLVGGGNKPAFAGNALERHINPALWSEGVQRLSESRGHVMIADAHPPDLNNPDLNYDRAVAVTVAAMAVSLLTDPSGIIWHPAGNATPPDVIPDFIQSLSHNLAPLPLWLRWLILPSTNGRNPGAASRGLLALLGMELEMAPNDYSLEKTVNDLFQIAAVHVRTGRVPPDGAQVRTKDKTWYHVVHHEHGTVTKTPVFRLTPVSDYSGN